MSPAAQGEHIRRILVAIDASPASLAALEIGAELAARFNAELVGIFVEDVNLLHLAELPFTREVGLYSTRTTRMDVTNMERQMRAQARAVRRRLASIAEGARLQWSFQTTRGIVHVALREAAENADLIVMGRTGWNKQRRLGSTARVMVLESPHHTMILRRRVRFGVPVLVAYDGSENGQKALAAISLVWDEESHLTVLILAEDAEQARHLQGEAEKFLAGLGAAPSFRWLKFVDEAILARILREEGCGVVILPAGSERLPGNKLLPFLNQTDCAVLLVR